MYTKHLEDDDTKIVDKTEDVLTQEIVNRWQVDDVTQWLTNEGSFATTVIKCFQLECIDGSVLLNLTENDLRDFRYRCGYDLRLGEIKKLWQSICNLKRLHIDSKEHNNKVYPRFNPCSKTYNCYNSRTVAATPHNGHYDNFNFNDYDSCAPDTSSLSDGCINTIPPEFFKTGISMAYSFLVTWITSFVMVIVHERVPDMKRYPPLPDIFLDNVPHIPWAFNMCEITGTLLFVIWLIVCIFHKYRMVLLRRFFALAGTVFLLRCVTMLITSLSVPGTHLQCNQKDYAVDDSVLAFSEALYLRISRAYVIWSGLGMSIQGVRTCGDYMFSGHTVTLTLLNFFITEYTPRHLYFLHTLTWLLNMFGIFFILAAHEHYSIDVFVAFYITSRLFLYYHTLANNQALMQRDSTRTRIWFPMFSYFESSVNGIIPNEYDSLSEIADKLLLLLMDVKDLIMLTANRVWLEAPSLPITASSTRFLPYQDSSAKLRNAATSTNNWTVLNNIASNSTANSEILAEIENYSLASKASGLKIGDINNKSLVTQKLESVTKENTSLGESKKPLKKSVNLSKFEQSSTTTTTTTNNNNNNNRDSSTIVPTDFSKKHL